MCAVLLAALAFAGCSDDDAASSLATNFDELEFSYEESDLHTGDTRLTVCLSDIGITLLS